MSRHVERRRVWPGRDAYRAPKPLSVPERLHGARARQALYVVALPERGAIPERLGLGAWILAAGRTVLDAGLIVPSDLHDPRARRRLRAWASRHRVDTALGECAWRVLDATAFCRDVLARHAYGGLGWLIGADLGRTLALIAAWWAPARSRWWPDAWTLGLPGWGAIAPRGDNGRDRWHKSTGYPVPVVQAVSQQSLRAGYSNARPYIDKKTGEKQPRGARETGRDGIRRIFRGRIVELLGAASAFDAVETRDLGQHLAAWGIEPVEPAPVQPDASGAALVTRLVTATHALALAVDREAARW